MGSLLAESARAKIVLALVGGRTLSAGVLAVEASVSPSTASYHLSRLVESGLITVAQKGRHRLFRLAGPEAAHLIEAAARVAPAQVITSLRQGTRAWAIRYARCCYDHLAGRLGVVLADRLCEQGIVTCTLPGSAPEELGGDRPAERVGYVVTRHGAAFLSDLGIEARRGDVGRWCLDWTECRYHLAGRPGRLLLAGLLRVGWLVGDPNSRALHLTTAGECGLADHLGVITPLLTPK
jgi:DNA-binding transcriptional ArsR family regulator